MIVYRDGTKALATVETVARFEEIFGRHFSTRTPTTEELKTMSLISPPKVTFLQ